MRPRNAFVELAAVLASLVPASAAASPGPTPLTVHAASLTQAGRQVTWSFQLNDPFSPAGLARDRRSLCLLIERERTGSVTGQLCVAPPRGRSQPPSLVYSGVTVRGPGPGRVITATVSRAGAKSFSASFFPAAVGIGYRAIRWQVISTLRPPRCVPQIPNRVGCYVLFPTRPTLAKLHTPQLAGCVPSGAPFVDNGPTDRREIALTFDDGPWPDTPQFLHILEREHVVATFFEIGEQIATWGQGGAIERRMLADGDIVGDHTWSHANVSGGGPSAQSQILETAGAIRRATRGFTPCLFRAPYGAVSGSLISEVRSLGFTTIQWNVDPRDWARPGTDAIYSNVVANAHSGAIVIQHDGGGDRSETLAALPREIATLRREGYQFVTVTQLLGQRLIYK